MASRAEGRVSAAAACWPGRGCSRSAAVARMLAPPPASNVRRPRSGRRALPPAARNSRRRSPPPGRSTWPRGRRRTGRGPAPSPPGDSVAMPPPGSQVARVVQESPAGADRLLEEAVYEGDRPVGLRRAVEGRTFAGREGRVIDQRAEKAGPALGAPPGRGASRPDAALDRRRAAPWRTAPPVQRGRRARRARLGQRAAGPMEEARPTNRASVAASTIVAGCVSGDAAGSWMRAWRWEL